MMNKRIPFLSIFAVAAASLSGCGRAASTESSDNASSRGGAVSENSNQSSTTDEIPAYVPSKAKTREARITDKTPDSPENVVHQEKMPDAPEGFVYQEGDDYFMKARNGAFSLKFSPSGPAFSVSFLNADGGATNFFLDNPVRLYLKGGTIVSGGYSSLRIVRYGIIATATLTSPNGSTFEENDHYYYSEEDVGGSINVERHLRVLSVGSGDGDYQLLTGIDTLVSSSQLEWYVPNEANGDFGAANSSQKYRVFRETLTGLPLAMMRDTSSGFSVSLARYQPVIDYATNSYACVGIYDSKNSLGNPYSAVEINYPTRDTARKYFSMSFQKDIVYDVSLLAGTYSSFDEAEIDVYQSQFELQNPSILDVDIEKVYQDINKDFKSFLLDTVKSGVHSYGLPWRVTIENGLIGPKSYQAGFVGQQIPCAYNMMAYGVRYGDSEALTNGKNIIDFWINGAHMMTSAGVPKIWYNGENNTWAGYPTFLRMAVDAMEGVLDAYRLAQKYSISTSGWKEAVTACADWLVSVQNADGSFYRCYNYQGTYYAGNESDITWNPGDIARSQSKHNTPIAVRFLGKMYEFTGEAKYLSAVNKAGDYIYKNLYPEHVYYGGTCDNPDAIDKEAGVYAMYAYDTLYTLTGESKWLPCLEQAAVFTMSSVLAVRYKVKSNASSLKAANAFKYGYTDGLSYICIGGTSLDNYAAYIYYELFRIYILTGKSVYLDMAEFIQENTKGTMDYDGSLGYAYPSLTPEATTIYSFGWSSAKDDNDVEGVWLPWQSAANAEPIMKMMETFGNPDVGTFRSTEISALRETLASYGVGGHEHKAIQ